MSLEISRSAEISPRALEFRQSFFWRIFIKYIFTTIYSFVWEYIFNIRGKLLYLLSSNRKISKNKFEKNGLKFINNNENFINIARLIKSEISNDLLEKEKKRILADPSDESYCSVLNAHLDNNLKEEIIKFALSDDVLSHVYAHLGVVAKITDICVLYNVPRISAKEEGSKLWHRDSDLYKSLNVFICISDLDDFNGPYYALDGDILPFYAVIPKHYSLKDSVWKRFRLSDHEFFSFIPKDKITKLVGGSGTGIYVDPALCYHKGGYCTEKDRLMLQITFSTEDRGLFFAGAANEFSLSQDFIKKYANTAEKSFIISAPSKFWSYLRSKGVNRFLFRLYSNIFVYFISNKIV